MKKENYYSASEYVAKRAGCTHSCYKTSDGRYVLTERDVRAALPQMTQEELITGFDIIPLSEQEALRLISENGYRITGDARADQESPVDPTPSQGDGEEIEPETPQAETEEQEEPNEKEE